MDAPYWCIRRHGGFSGTVDGGPQLAQQSNQQSSTSQQQTPAPQPPEKKKRNGSNMTNWDRFVPPGMVMPGGRK